MRQCRKTRGSLSLGTLKRREIRGSTALGIEKVRKVLHFSRMPQSGGVQNKDNVRTVSQFSALGLRKVTTVSRICPSWRFDLVDFARGVARMLVSGSLSLPAKGGGFSGCRRLPAVSRERGAIFRKSKRFSPEGSKKQQKHFEIPYLFSVFEKIKLPQGRTNVVKYVIPYRWRREVS